MANMRKQKQRLGELLAGDDWAAHLNEIAAMGSQAVGALFSFLSRDPQLMHRAARALGLTTAAIYKTDPQAATEIIRRFMWHMNEESGNIGWGIPAAFAEALVASPELAEKFGHILNTYIMDLGFDDNYCDHDALRRTCYWAIGRHAQAHPRLTAKAHPWLVRGLQDEDSICRGMAAWALGQMAPDLMDAPALRMLAQAGNTDRCEVFENDELREYGVSELAQKTLDMASNSA